MGRGELEMIVEERGTGLGVGPSVIKAYPAVSARETTVGRKRTRVA